MEKVGVIYGNVELTKFKFVVLSENIKVNSYVTVSEDNILCVVSQLVQHSTLSPLDAKKIHIMQKVLKLLC